MKGKNKSEVNRIKGGKEKKKRMKRTRKLDPSVLCCSRQVSCGHSMNSGGRCRPVWAEPYTWNNEKITTSAEIVF